MNKNMMACAMNDVELYSISQKIYVQEIEENATVKTDAVSRPYYGMTSNNSVAHDLMTIKITFMVKEKNRIVRTSILQDICSWARKGYLTTSAHPGQRIYVLCTELPTMKTFDWSEDMTMVFTAYGEACWEDIGYVRFEANGTTSASSSTFKPRGTATGFLEAEITNVSSSALTTVTLTANEYTISLTGLSIPQNAKVVLTYDEQHYMVLKGNDVSIMDKRSGADDLLLYPYEMNTVSCTTNVACDVLLKARGMYR